MYIKQVEMSGFKSFADRTTVELDRGVVAIVGPNGCGKSNVADALRWVFGEQNPRVLRGAHMEDIIFNGTDNRKPVGRAEVSVTFVECEGVLPYEYHEVTITRRLFRSGESQYLINNTPCLLRDVRELFMGTGIGTSAYFLLEQGKIDMILSAKPEDRRSVFEEAAGIMKYKVKKKASLQKLELTQANLVRLQDIIREVKRQIISLERQAGKARRYQQARDELKQLELKCARKEFEERQQEFDLLNCEVISRQEFKDEVTQKIEELQKRIYEVKSAHQAIFDESRQIEKRDLELDHKVQSHQAEENFIRENLEEFRRRSASFQEEIRLCENRLTDLERELSAVEEGRNKFLELNAGERGDLEKRRSRLEEMLGLYKQESEALDVLKNRMIDVNQEEAQLKNQMMVSHHRQKDLIIQDEKWMSEIGKLQEFHAQKLSELNEWKVKHSGLFSDHLGCVDEQKSLLDQKTQLEIQLRKIEDAQRVDREEILKLEARRETLLDLGMAEEDSVSAGAGKFVTLGSVVQVPPQYRKAVRTALGVKWSAHLIARRESIVKEPHAVFLGLDCIFRPPVQGDVHLVGGFVARACEVVQSSAEYQTAISSLMSDLVIVKDFDSLTHLDSSFIGRFRFVSLDGDWLDRDGTLCCFGMDDHSVNMSQMGQDIAALNEHHTNLKLEDDRCKHELGSLNEAIHSSGEKIRSKELELAHMNAQVERLETKVKDLEDEKWSLEKDREGLKRDLTEMEKNVSHMTGRLDALNRELDLISSEISGKEKILEELSKQRENTLMDLGEVRTLMRTMEDEEKRLSARLEEIRSTLIDQTQSRLRRQEEINSIQTKVKESEGRIAFILRENDLFQAERDELSRRSQAVSIEIEKIHQSLADDEKNLTDQTQALNEIREALSEFELKRSQVLMQKEALYQRMKDKYDLDLAQWPLDVNFDFGQTMQKITELQEKIREMGDVNLVAIQEFDEYKTRYDFLIKQQEDMVRAKDDLVKAIQKVNGTIKELFLNTFEKIRETYNDMFRRLFGGGRTVLELMDEGDVLECGIHIAAQPPGKKLQTISLLSGGERTLTALALLLAIFKVRPSPFCFMDEMDAALDESNIVRFLSMLNDFRADTQFILITHNKKTISVADVVYGVTMEESGVSKVVSIRLAMNQEKMMAQAAS